MTESVKKLQQIRAEDDKENIDYGETKAKYCYWDKEVYEKPKSDKAVVKPSRVVIFNIMRACAGVQNPEEIWVKVQAENNGE